MKHIIIILTLLSTQLSYSQDTLWTMNQESYGLHILEGDSVYIHLAKVSSTYSGIERDRFCVYRRELLNNNLIDSILIDEIDSSYVKDVYVQDLIVSPDEKYLTWEWDINDDYNIYPLIDLSSNTFSKWYGHESFSNDYRTPIMRGVNFTSDSKGIMLSYLAYAKDEYENRHQQRFKIIDIEADTLLYIDSVFSPYNFALDDQIIRIAEDGKLIFQNKNTFEIDSSYYKGFESLYSIDNDYDISVVAVFLDQGILRLWGESDASRTFVSLPDKEYLFETDSSIITLYPSLDYAISSLSGGIEDYWAMQILDLSDMSQVYEYEGSYRSDDKYKINGTYSQITDDESYILSAGAGSDWVALFHSRHDPNSIMKYEDNNSNVYNLKDLKRFEFDNFNDIVVYNVNGEVVFRNRSIDLTKIESLPKGIYFLKTENKLYKFINE